MKKLALFLAFALILSCFAGCGEKEKSQQEVSSDTTASQNLKIPEWQDEIIQKVIEELKTTHKNRLTAESSDDQYLEIKNTRLIKIKDGATDVYEIFNDVDYVVEFMLLTNYYGASPYYFYTTDSYAIYKDGRIKEHDAFSFYRNHSNSSDFSEFIEEIYDLGGAYNEVYDLKDHTPQEPDAADLPDPKPIAEGNSVELRNEDGDVLLIEADVELVSAVCIDEAYYLKLEFTSNGAKRLQNITEEYIGEKLPLYLNNTLISMPTVPEVISDGVMLLPCIDEETLLDIFNKMT